MDELIKCLLSFIPYAAGSYMRISLLHTKCKNRSLFLKHEQTHHCVCVRVCACVCVYVYKKERESVCVCVELSKRLFYNSIMESQKGACFIMENENECIQISGASQQPKLTNLCFISFLVQTRERERGR